MAETTPKAKPAAAKPDPAADEKPASATTAAEVREDVAEQAETTRSAQQPYPAYEQMSTDELRSAADSAGVGVPADVEKSLLIGALRKSGADVEQADTVQVDGAADPLPSLDLMTIEDLRNLADERDVALDEETERGYLVGQLRAVASGATAAQSAQVGSAAPADADATATGGVAGATPKVSDKDSGRG